MKNRPEVSRSTTELFDKLQNRVEPWRIIVIAVAPVLIAVAPVLTLVFRHGVDHLWRHIVAIRQPPYSHSDRRAPIRAPRQACCPGTLATTLNFMVQAAYFWFGALKDSLVTAVLPQFGVSGINLQLMGWAGSDNEP